MTEHVFGRLAHAAAAGALLVGIAFGAGARADSFTMGYSVGFLTDPFQAIQVDLSMQGAKAAGLKTLPVANANGDPGKQITDIHNLIAQGVQGIILVPTDSDAIVPALNFAASKNVPVVSIDIGPAGGKTAMIVRANNLRMGEDACKWLAKAVGGKGTVLSMMGDQATTNGRDRTTGFDDCMKKNYPDIKVIEQPTYWKTDKATAVAQTVVTSTPDLAGIYMQSDSVMLAGVLNVLKSAGKLKAVGETGHIFLISIDATPFALEKIREGMLDAAVSQPLNLYVKYGLEYLQAAVAGKTFKPGPTDHDSTIVDYKGNPMDLLPAPVVTKEQASDPGLWGNQVKK
ncbi:MAG: sugar ABC transporter substrate-binding protein [Methylobacteriaceae bacterium]|nr:sugar ABC transporter substrate-binding protein [Methylobacteriaceae bacterium]